MSEPTRKDKIVAMLADDPDDLFLRYGLAMELQKEGGHAESLALLDELMQQEPPYVPAYFMAAQQLAQLSRIPEAQATARTGIEVAVAQQDLHAAGEMREFLATLES
ncbi:MAG: hypothetical protein GY888_01170 [Planctomycetaceae bacterium]|jgi:predicted Zn-dependent protease|nr:hypothetical protein [Planctomycetaceae bacterium]